MTAINHHLKCECALAEIMRSVVPVKGIDFEKLMHVHLKKGDSIDEHQHDVYHTALYYPADTAPVVVTPTAGMIIYLPPGTPHGVPLALDRRDSVAMLVEDPS